jgi:hypothetical protein
MISGHRFRHLRLYRPTDGPIYWWIHFHELLGLAVDGIFDWYSGTVALELSARMLTKGQASFAFILDFLFINETYPPVILIEKAAELRRRTKNWGIHAKQEEIEVDFRELVERNFSRPLRMLVTEPIVLLLRYLIV